ncbi:MAG: cupin domain-containing protein [bacterium]
MDAWTITMSGFRRLRNAAARGRESVHGYFGAGGTSLKVPTVSSPGETIHVGPLGIRYLVTGADSNGSVEMFEVTVPGGEKLRAPAHSHDGYEETVYGLAGVLTFTVDGRRNDVAVGQSLCIPRGAVHRFDNYGDEEARILSVISPGVLGPEYFREAAAVINAAAGGPPDLAKMAEVMRRHGLTPAPPQA